MVAASAGAAAVSGVLGSATVLHGMGFAELAVGGGEKSSLRFQLHTRGRTMLSKIFATMVAAAVLALYGCNTIEGAGKDVERGGEKIQSGAEKAKAKM